MLQVRIVVTVVLSLAIAVVLVASVPYVLLGARGWKLVGAIAVVLSALLAIGGSFTRLMRDARLRGVPRTRHADPLDEEA